MGTTTSALSDIQHLIRLSDLRNESLERVLGLADRYRQGYDGSLLTGKTVGTLFFRRSLRTRASLESAIHRLGGNPVNMTGMSDLWELENREGTVMDGRSPEHVRDAARVLSSYVDALAIRPGLSGQSWEHDKSDADIRSWARHATVPVINMESAMWHPLQALADLMTLRTALGECKSKKLAIVWTHSPQAASIGVVHSLLLAGLRSSMDVRIAHPSGFELDPSVIHEARGLAENRGGSLEFMSEAEAAADGAHAIYARSWLSTETYGNPTLDSSRRSRHRNWSVDEKLMARGDSAYFLHAMPVRRNVEVTDEVLDGPRSLIYEQAANRLHTQMALLATLLGS